MLVGCHGAWGGGGGQLQIKENSSASCHWDVAQMTKLLCTLSPGGPEDGRPEWCPHSPARDSCGGIGGEKLAERGGASREAGGCWVCVSFP